MDDPIHKYLPKKYKYFLVGDKKRITIKDLLTMSAGLKWNEQVLPYTTPYNIRTREMYSDDSVEFTLLTPSVHDRGEVFTYSSGYVTLMGEIIKNATGAASLADFARKSSLSNLCLKNAYWDKQTDGRQNAALGAQLRPRDMAKIGQLVLDKGVWNDQPLIDKNWIEESTAKQISTNDPDWKGYGYYWWNRTYSYKNKEYKAVAAQGAGGQRIVIIEDLNLVIVTTAYSFLDTSALDMVYLIIPAFAK